MAYNNQYKRIEKEAISLFGDSLQLSQGLLVHVPVDWDKELLCTNQLLPIQAFELAYIYLLRWVHWNSKQIKFRKLYHLEQDALNLLAAYERDLSKVAADLANDPEFLHRLELKFSNQSENDSDKESATDAISNDSEWQDTGAEYDINAADIAGYSVADSIVDEALFVDKQLAVCSFLSKANPNARPVFSALSDELQSSLKSLAGALVPKDRAWVAECLNHYKHAKMDYGFLGTNSAQPFMGFSFNDRERDELFRGERYTENTHANGIIANQIKPLLGQLSELTQGIGLADLIDDLASGHTPTPLSKDFLNIIPGSSHLSKCAPVLLALSSGAHRSPHNLPSILNQVVGHLIECGPRRQSRAVSAHTHVVVVIFEKWDERNTVQARKHLARFKRHGVQFVFLHSQVIGGRHTLTEKVVSLP